MKHVEPDWKETFYASYVSTHTAQRRSQPNQHTLSIRRKTFEYQIGKFIPVNPDSAIIDIGCGNGDLVDWLHKRGCHSAHGIDVSTEQIALGTSLGINNLVCSDTESFFRNDGRTWKFMIFRNIIEHFTRPAQMELLHSCTKKLASDGRIIIQVPNGESPFFGRIRYGDYTHEMAFTASSIRQLLAVLGFKNIAVFPCRQVSTSIKSFLRLTSWKIVEHLIKGIIFAETGSKKMIVTQDLIAVADA